MGEGLRDPPAKGVPHPTQASAWWVVAVCDICFDAGYIAASQSIVRCISLVPTVRRLCLRSLTCPTVSESLYIQYLSRVVQEQALITITDRWQHISYTYLCCTLHDPPLVHVMRAFDLFMLCTPSHPYQGVGRQEWRRHAHHVRIISRYDVKARSSWACRHHPYLVVCVHWKAFASAHLSLSRYLNSLFHRFSTQWYPKAFFDLQYSTAR